MIRKLRSKRREKTAFQKPRESILRKEIINTQNCRV